MDILPLKPKKGGSIPLSIDWEKYNKKKIILLPLEFLSITQVQSRFLKFKNERLLSFYPILFMSKLNLRKWE